MKTGLAGSIMVAPFFAIAASLPTPDSDFASGNFIILIFPILLFGTIVGALGTSLCLLFVGLPIAYLAEEKIDSIAGLAIALVAALVATTLIAAMTSNYELGLLILPYAIAAAIIYRREILLERLLDEAMG